MKKLSAIIFLLIFIQTSFAQTYSPVSFGKKYNYTCDTSNVIFTVFTDSISVNGNDTLFYLNRIVVPCDTIEDISVYQEYSYGTNSIFLKNQPIFLEKQFIKTDSTLWFHSPSSFVIYPQKNIDESWLYDTSNNVTATVKSRNTETVLGESDIVTLFLLSTGDTILLSQNYGFIKFPLGDGNYFRLIGIEGINDLGYSLGDYRSFFNYSVGDSFVYWETDQNPGAPDDHTKHYHYSITAKNVFPDYIEYEISGYYCVVLWECIGHVDFTDIVRYGTGYTDQYFGYSYQLSNRFGLEYFSQIRYLNDGNEVVEGIPSILKNFVSEGLHEDILTEVESCQGGSLSCQCSYDGWCNFLRLEAGLGLFYDKTCGFENFSGRELLQFVHDGITVYDVLTSAPEKELQNTIVSASPIPAKSTITLTYNNEYKYAEIITVTGKTVKTIPELMPNETIIDISDLKAGLYFVIFKGKNKSQIIKVCVN
jgi:hypothetical protein